MRATFWIWLAVAAISSPSLAETVASKMSADKITEVGLLCPTDNETARKQYNSGKELQQQGKLGQAKEAYLKAVENDPRYCDAMDNLGQMLRQEGDIKQAISWYQRSLKVRPDNAVAHQNLAVAYRLGGDRDKALVEYQWLVENDPRNPEGFYGLGQTYLESERSGDAIGALKMAADLYRQQDSPLVSDAYYLLGVAYVEQGGYQKAKEYLELSYPGREADPETNYLLGLCYLDPANPNRVKGAQYLGKAQQLGVKVPAALLQKLGQ